MGQSVRSHGVPLPSFGKLLLLTGLFAMGWWGWTEYARIQSRRQLWNPRATATDRLQSINAWIAGGVASVPALIAGLSEDDYRSRRDAARALGEIGVAAQAAVPALRHAHNDPNWEVRAAAIVALEHIEPDAPETVSLLMVMATDDEPEVREHARDAIERLGEIALPDLLTLLKSPQPVVRQEVIRLAHRIAPDAPEFASALRRLTQDPDVSVRGLAMVTLLSIRRASPEEVLSWMREKDPRIVSESINALSQFGSDAVMAVPELIECLERSDLKSTGAYPGAVDGALRWLKAFGSASRPAIPALVRMLESRECSVDETGEILRVLVATRADRETVLPLLVPALGVRGLSETAGNLLAQVAPDVARRKVPMLVERLHTSDRESRVTALQALCGLGSTAAAAVPDLVRLLSDESPSIFVATATTLGRIGPDAADSVPEIVAQLKRHGTESSLTEYLIDAAGRIGPAAEPAVPQLMDLIADRRRFSVIRALAMIAMTRIGERTPELVVHLRAALGENARDIQSTALLALAALHVDDETLLPEILACLRSSHHEIRCTAAWTSAEIVGCRPEIVTALAGLLQDYSPDVRLAAAKALGRLGPQASAAVPALQRARSAPENAVSTGWDPPQFLSRPIVESAGQLQKISQAMAEAVKQICAKGRSSPQGL